jgi:hypothetical protein
MKQSIVVIASVCCLAVAIAAPLRLHTFPKVPIRVRPSSHSSAGNFTPIPPPIQCEDFYVSNGVACFYLVNGAKKLVTPLVIGNVSMPDKNPHFVVDPPKQITSGGWFSFHDLLDWSNQTAPVVEWSGFVQYSSKDSQGNTYIFQADFQFGGGIVDIGLKYPDHVGIDVKSQVEAKICVPPPVPVSLTVRTCRFNTIRSGSLASKSSMLSR